MELYEKIKYFRNREKLTQEELSHKVGISINTLQRYEYGEREPNISTLQRIADALGVPVADLMDDTVIFGDPEDEDFVKMMDPGYDERRRKINKIMYEIRHSDLELDKKYRLNEAFDKLNNPGQEKVTEYAEDLTKVPEYRRTDQAADDQDTATDQDDQDNK